MSYFVIAIHPSSGIPMPIMDGSDENDTDRIKLYSSHAKAEEMAKDHPLCKAGGYKIVQWPYCDA